MELTEGLLIQLHPLLAERILTLSEIKDWVDYFVKEPVIDIRKLRKLDLDIVKHIFTLCLETRMTELESTLRTYAQFNNLKAGDVFYPVRIAITGREVALPLFESMQILGEEKCRERIKLTLAQISQLEV